MNQITELHRQAMAIADSAFAARRRGDREQARLFFEEGMRAEREAAALVPSGPDEEPSRSVLYRSAATLALEAGLIRECEQLAAAGLTGAPPEEIADELRDVMERAQFHRHLILRGIALDPRELQFSLVGDAVGPGIARSDYFIMRVDAIQKLLRRTGERERQVPFRERGPSPKSVQEQTEVYVSVPRAACFAVTFRVGRPSDQMLLDFGEPDNLIPELLSCLELVNRSDVEALRSHIPDDAYYRNFVGLARQLAPDGRAVKMVGLTAVQQGHERRLELTRPAETMPLLTLPAEAQDRAVLETITGQLHYADAHDPNKQQIALFDSKKKKHKIIVPAGVDDIVRPLWGEMVTVKAYRSQRALRLADIQRAEPEAESPGSISAGIGTLFAEAKIA